jgi:hypothetical protein
VEVDILSKFTVIAPGPFTIAVVDVLLFLIPILIESVDQKENLYPAEGETDKGRAPESTHIVWPEGFVVAAPRGLMFNETRYWFFQFQLILEGADIANVTEAEFPNAGILPVPNQPVQTI